MITRDKVWYGEINQVRGCAIIILLLYHAGFFRDEFIPGLEYLNIFPVPIFFFISGLVLTLRYKDEINLKSFYKKRFQYLLPAYFFWSIITTAFVSGLTLQSFLDILTGHSLGIWFLFVLFELYLLFPFLLRICKKKYGKWLFGTVLAFVSISTIFIWNFLPDSIFFRFYYALYVIKDGYITLEISRLFWFIPFSIYFIFGILVGYNYESFKEKLQIHKNTITIIWIALLITIPLIINFFNISFIGYFNIEVIIFAFSSILFFFLVFTRRSSKFFDINGNIAVGIFLISLLVLILLWRFFYGAGEGIGGLPFFPRLIIFCGVSVLFFVLAYRLWGQKFFYFSKRSAIFFFLVPTLLFAISSCFLPFPPTSIFGWAIISGSDFFLAYLIILCIIAGLKQISHYQYFITEIRE